MLSFTPSGTRHTNSPVAALTAMRLAHGGRKHGRFPSERPSLSRAAALIPPPPTWAYGNSVSLVFSLYRGFGAIQPDDGSSFEFTKMYPSRGSVAVPPQFVPPV